MSATEEVRAHWWASAHDNDGTDSLAAIEARVETGSVPERIIARRTAFPGRSRPLCPYSLEARPGCDPRDADAFVCRTPQPTP